jgi:uncharacterized protein YkwD
MQAALNLINETRAQNGLGPMTLNMTQSTGTGNCVGSIGHSTAMQQSGTIWHTNASYPQASFSADICVFYHSAGENVGEWSGNELTAIQAIHNTMMNEQHDPAYCAVYDNHACNILSPVFTQVGIGLVYVGNTVWYTTDFIG